MSARPGMIDITEAGRAAMAFIASGGSFFKARRQGQDADREITPAGYAAMRDYELARPLAQGAGPDSGVRSLPERLAAADPERPAAAADFPRGPR